MSETVTKHSRGKPWAIALVSIFAVALIVFLVFFGLYHPRKLVAYVKKKPEELLKAEYVQTVHPDSEEDLHYLVKKDDLKSFAKDIFLKTMQKYFSCSSGAP